MKQVLDASFTLRCSPHDISIFYAPSVRIILLMQSPIYSANGDLNMPEGSKLIGFIRPNHTRRLLWLMLGAIPMVAGSMLIGRSYAGLEAIDPFGLHVAHSPELAEGFGSLDFNVFLFFVGFLLIISGPVGVLWSLRRLWLRDALVLIRDDALVVVHGGNTFELLWDDVAHVSFRQADETIVCELRSEDEYLLPDAFYCGDAKDTAQRLEQIRRRSSFGML